MYKNFTQTRGHTSSILEALLLTIVSLGYAYQAGYSHFYTHSVELSIWMLLGCFLFLEALKWINWQYHSHNNNAQLWAKSTLLRLTQERQRAHSLTGSISQIFKPQKLYLILGNKQCGKSTLLTNTGAEACDSGFQYQEKGLIFHQWWQHQQNYCLETSCLMGPEKNHHEHFKHYMNSLIKNLAWYHQANSFSGIVLTVSCQNLLQERDHHHSQRLQHLQNQIQDIASVAPHIPLFVVVTFFDIIPHFKDFFHDFEHSDFDKPLGYTIKTSQQKKNSLKKQIDKITQALESHLIHTLEKYPTLHHQDMHKKIHAFQHEMYTLQPKLYQCIQTITKTCSNPIGGVLYTCQHTDKKQFPGHNDPKNQELSHFPPQHLPRAFFSKNVLSAIDSCTKFHPSRKTQSVIAFALLAYLSSALPNIPLLEWLGSWQSSTYEQITHAPQTSQFYENKKSYDLPILPIKAIQKQESKLTPPQIEELSILNNQGSSYQDFLQKSAWPKLRDKLILFAKQHSKEEPSITLSTLIFSHMLTKSIVQNLDYMQNWLKKRVEEAPDTWDADTQQHIIDLMDKKLTLDGNLTTSLSHSFPEQSLNDTEQIKNLVNAIQPLLSQSYNDSTAVGIACNIKEAEPSLLGPWQQYKNSEDCRKTYLATTTQEVITALIQKITALTQYPTADTDMQKYRRKLQYLERNIDDIVDGLKTETQNIANGPQSKLTEPNSELDNLISAVEQIDIVLCKNTLHKMQRVLYHITNPEQTHYTAFNWLSDVMLNHNLDKELIPHASHDILTQYQLEIFWQAIITASKKELSTLWQQAMNQEWKNINQSYPFNPQAIHEDTPPEVFDQLFAHGGKLDQFIEKNLMPFIQDSPENGLEWKTAFGIKIPLSHDTLHMIMSQKIIQSMYYPNNSTTPTFHATLQFQNATDSIKQIHLSENHQKQTLSRERPIPLSLQWPNSGMSFHLQAELDNQDLITFEHESGFWNLIKVLKKHTKKRLNAHQVQLEFKQGEHRLTLVADNLKKISPLTEDITESFRLPSNLFLPH